MTRVLFVLCMLLGGLLLPCEELYSQELAQPRSIRPCLATDGAPLLLLQLPTAADELVRQPQLSVAKEAVKLEAFMSEPVPSRGEPSKTAAFPGVEASGLAVLGDLPVRRSVRSFEPSPETAQLPEPPSSPKRPWLPLRLSVR